MPRRRTAPNPFTAWTRLALRTSEMMLASAEVIAHRTARMASAGVTPQAHDRAEFMLMGSEKVEAALECAAAAARHTTQHAWGHAARAWQDAWRLGIDLTLLAGSATPAQAVHRQARVMQQLARSTGADGAASMLALSEQMLTPVHRRTAANVKRLRRARR